MAMFDLVFHGHTFVGLKQSIFELLDHSGG
jgi:hypothetical protein